MSSHPRTTITIRKRIVYLFAVIFLVLAVIVGRYAWVQIVWSKQLQQWAVDQWTNDTRIAAKRGKILDRNGSPLAVSGNVERVDAFIRDINDSEKKHKITREKIAEQLSGVLNIDKKDILKKLNKKLPNGMPLSSVTIVRRIEKSQGNKIRDMKLPGIVITEDTKRYYSNGNFLAHVLGNTDIDGNGRAGIEIEYNNELKGIPGRFMGETDRYHRELPYSIATYIPPKNGDDLVLTIDQSIQYFTEKALEKGMQEYKPKQISAIVMDPKTGEILAMANKPDYDPNNPINGDVDESMKLWRNRVVNDVFEPGSIFKVFTASAAIEENVVKDSDKFACSGSYKVADRIIHCAKRTGHGIQTFQQIVQNSCNVGFAMLGEKLQKQKLYKYLNAFGFGRKTNIDYPGEANGIIIPIEKVGPVELATEAFGQSISITAVQYITGLAAIANDGNMLEPHLVKRVLNTDENGNTSVIEDVKSKLVKQVISAETAKKLRQILETVVSIGGGKKAYVPGYHVGGKTGTAQKVINGHYAPQKYVSSFSAMVPASNPRFVLLISIDEPDPSNYYAGNTAAPLAKGLIEDICRYMGIAPDYNNLEQGEISPKEVIIPEVRGSTSADAQKILKDNILSYKILGNGNIVYDMSPKPGVSAKENTKVQLYLGIDKNTNNKVAVPDFTEKTQKEIEVLAKSLGLNVSYTGDGIGNTQDILPGTEVDKNTTVKVLLEQPED